MDDTGERLIPEGHTQTLTYGEHLSRYLSVLGIAKNRTILDIACGAGYGTRLIASTAKKVWGVDYSTEAIDYAKDHYSATNIKYLVGDAHNIPLDNESVDVVVSLETIEHLKNPEKFIKEVKRVLKKGGKFVVSTPNDDEFIEGNKFHLHEFDLKELKKLIGDNFKNVEYYYQGTYFGAGVFSQKLFEGSGEWQGSIGKTFGQPSKKAIYFLAVASDSNLEMLSTTTVLSDAWSAKEDTNRENNRLQVETEARELIQSLQKQILATENDRDDLRNELNLIKNSKGWRVLSKLYKFKQKLNLRSR